MEKIITFLQEIKHATKIVISQQRDYEYDYEQTQMLLEIAKMQQELAAHQFLTSQDDAAGYTLRLINQQYVELQNIIHQQIKPDPIGSYVNLKRKIRHTHIKHQNTLDQNMRKAYEAYLGMLQ